MLSLNSLMIGSQNPKILADFYKKILGKSADWHDEEWWGWQIGECHLTVGKHSEVKGTAKEPQRVILNLETKEVKKEFERIKKLGTKVIKKPYQMESMWIATFADPDGNYFQLVTPWSE